MRRVITALALFTATSARAAPVERDVPLLSPWGMSLSVGGGVTDFVGGDVKTLTDAGGAWDVRFVLGTRKSLAVEAAYVGTAQRINALGMMRDSALLGSGLEAGARLNFIDGDAQPYFFAGAAWKRYRLSSADTNTSTVKNEDDVFEVPLAVGFTWRFGHAVADVRAVYRPAERVDLIAARLDNYGLGAHLGFEF